MLKMGIIGMGKTAREHVNWIIQNKDMALSAICEKNVARLKEIYRYS